MIFFDFYMTLNPLIAVEYSILGLISPLNDCLSCNFVFDVLKSWKEQTKTLDSH